MQWRRERPEVLSFLKMALRGLLTPSRAFLLGSIFFAPGMSAHAASEFDFGSLFSTDALLGTEVTNAVVKTVGLGLDYRPYEPATPLGTKIGLDIGVEATLAKVPPDLATTLAANPLTANAAASLASLPVLPLIRIHLIKGVGEKAEIGLAGIIYQTYRVYSGGIKIVVYQPEEGPIWAIRGGYSLAYVGYVTTDTYSAQVLISRPMNFADPYFGVGGQYARGTVTFPVTVGGQVVTTLVSQGSAWGLMAFLGVQFTIPNLGLQITLQGEANTAETHVLGAKAGFSF